MLTISLPPELEQQLRLEAQKRGVTAEELAVEAMRAFLQSNGAPDETVADDGPPADAEAARLAAIDKFMETDTN